MFEVTSFESFAWINMCFVSHSWHRSKCPGSTTVMSSTRLRFVGDRRAAASLPQPWQSLHFLGHWHSTGRSHLPKLHHQLPVVNDTTKSRWLIQESLGLAVSSDQSATLESGRLALGLAQVAVEWVLWGCSNQFISFAACCIWKACAQIHRPWKSSEPLRLKSIWVCSSESR